MVSCLAQHENMEFLHFVVLLYFVFFMTHEIHENRGGRRGRDRMVVGFKLPMLSLSITTNVVSSHLDHSEVYNIM